MLNTIMKQLAITLIVLGCMTSCSVQKRHYTKGYYVSWKKQTSHPSKESIENTAMEPVLQNTRHLAFINETNKPKESVLLANAVTPKLTHFGPVAQTKTFHPPDSCGDKIVFKNGDELLVKVEEVNSAFISYRPCDHLNGPLRKIAPESVFMIRYVNGTKEVIKSANKPMTEVRAPATARKSVPKIGNGYAKASFILSFFFWLYFIPSIISLIMGAIALKQFETQPDKYSGKWMAVTGMIISAAILFILLLAILAAFL